MKLISIIFDNISIFFACLIAVAFLLLFVVRLVLGDTGSFQLALFAAVPAVIFGLLGNDIKEIRRRQE